MERRYTFGKEEHLCGKTAIDELYKTGESFFLYPFRAQYKEVSEESVPVRCLVQARSGQKQNQKADAGSIPQKQACAM